MARDHARQLGTEVVARPRPLAGQHERGFVHALGSRKLALRQRRKRRIVAGVVALGQIVDLQIAVDVLRLVVPVADETRLPEKRRHPEKLGARARSQVSVDRFEVPRAVVARHARRVEAEEDAADVDGQRVEMVEPVGDAVVIRALDHAALQLIAAADNGQRRNGGVHFGRRGQHVMHEKVVGPVDAQLLLQPVVKRRGSRAGFV